MESTLHALLGTTESSLQINEFTMVEFMDTEIVWIQKLPEAELLNISGRQYR